MKLPINPAVDKTIVVLGFAASGKSYLCSMLFGVGADLCSRYKVFHTDDYMQYGFEQSLYKVMLDVRTHVELHPNTNCVIEGIQGYRLLRKWAELGIKGPDLIITCVAPVAERMVRYEKRGKAWPVGFDKTLSKIWMDYCIMENDMQHKPRRIMYETVANKVVL